MTTITPHALRNALGKFATGVTVVTTANNEGTPIGVTASSFNSVSLDPPLVLWSLAKDAQSMNVFSTSGHFTVHVLASRQVDISNAFARKGEDKFTGINWRPNDLGSPLLPDYAAQFQCKTTYQYEGGDHIIFVGEVIAFDAQDKAPLVFHAGQYADAKSKPAPDSLSDQKAVDLGAGQFSEDFLLYQLARAHFQASNPVRKAWAEVGMSETDYLCLSLLSMNAPLSEDEISERLDHTGHLPTGITLPVLIARDWIKTEDQNGKTRCVLTDTGRDTFISVLSRAKALEEQILAHFAPHEIAEAKHFLQKVIRITDADVPELWRKA